MIGRSAWGSQDPTGSYSREGSSCRRCRSLGHSADRRTCRHLCRLFWYARTMRR
jgi:hypothetical protein